MEVRRSIVRLLRDEAARAHPAECCGLLLGRSGLIEAARPVRNVAADPARHFELDPQALIDAHRAERAGGPCVLGYYHSHPTGLAQPSATDRAQASGDGRIWAIIAGREVRLWRDGATALEPLSYDIADS